MSITLPTTNLSNEANNSKTSDADENLPIYQEPGFIIAMVFLALFGVYIVTSHLFRKCPHLLHARKQPDFLAAHISHRGGAGENLENTITAFHHALDCGTEMLEIDVHITQDDVVVVSHDNNLRRTTGSDVLVTETLYSELPLLKQSLKPDFYWDHMTVGGDDRSIPSLEDVFRTFPGTPINVDIKIDNDRLIEKVSELITEYKREDITVWGNRSKKIVDKLYKTNPRVPILFSVKRVVNLLVLYYTGLLPFFPLREQYFEIIMPSLILDNADKFQTNFGRGARFMLWLADFLLMSKPLFSHLKRRGIQVYIWVLNEEEDFARAFQYGADGIMTDFPTKLSQFLEDHPQYKSKAIM